MPQSKGVVSLVIIESWTTLSDNCFQAFGVVLWRLGSDLTRSDQRWESFEQQITDRKRVKTPAMREFCDMQSCPTEESVQTPNKTSWKVPCGETAEKVGSKDPASARSH